ncbi:MAG: patatin-like phospholipase family protein [Myxococcaceae bacterium]|nr:MAG: patatin-like phospholipase family protein [Myxococcaceae bacterium]
MSGEPSDRDPSRREASITPEQGTLEQLASEEGDALLGAMAASARPKLGAVDRMGLALSGGGYRAAAFHLGVMGVLHRVGLLPTVRVLSTVSGGSIVGAGWLVSLAESKGFEEFERAFRRWLSTTDVVALAGAKLSRAGDGQTPSLIRAAAAVYAQSPVIGDFRFGDFREGFPVEDIVINATEFTTGNVFRLTRTASSRASIGNQKVPVKREVLDRVRLADAVAASSCFPGAFEPLVWPTDFDLDGLDATVGSEPVYLMDGGIVDNQGISSVELAVTRAANRASPLDLVVISDVFQHGRDFLSGAQSAASPVPSVILALLLLAILLGVNLAVAIATLVRTGLSAGTGLSLFVAAGLVLLPLAAGVSAWWSLRKSVAARWNVLAVLGGFGVGDLVQAMAMRARSVLAILSNVFMKRVRSQEYGQVRDFLSRRVRCVRVSINDHERWKDDPEVTEALRETCQRAFGMATTLWCSEAEVETLVAAGRIAACKALLDAARSDETKAAFVDALEALWSELRAAGSERK